MTLFNTKTILASLSTIAITTGIAVYATTSTIAPVKAEITASAPQQVYRVGIEDGYYPYEYLDKSGKFTGYDVETLELVCAEIKAKCELERGQFDALIPNLLFRKTDFVISALSITADRKKKVDFSISYVPPQAAVFIVDNNSMVKKPEDLKVVGVQQGTTLAKYLAKMNNGKYQVVTYPSFDTAMLDLKANRVQAVFESFDVSQKYLDDKKRGVKTLGPKVYSPELSEGTGIAFRKDKESVTLRMKINAALTKLDKEGKFAALRKKYNIRTAD